MTEREKIEKFWLGREAVLQSMFLRLNPQELNEAEREEIIGYFPDLSKKRILDLAAGIGRFTRYFSSQGKRLVSVDLAPRFVEKNRAEHSDCTNVSFLCSHAMDLQFQDGCFDFVFINWLFIYLNDKEVELLLDRIHRWLTPGGGLFFRESCDLVRSSKSEEYVAYYRQPTFYESVVSKKFTILREDYIRTYVDFFADPLQHFWLCKKKSPSE